MRVNARGQVTIPARIRKDAGLGPGTEVSLQLDGDGVLIVKEAQPRASGAQLVAHLKKHGTNRRDGD